MHDELFIDFHAHHESLAGERVIQDGTDTRGRHPWHLSLPHSHTSSLPHFITSSLPHFSTPSLPHFSTSPLLAIGESGLDRLCDTPYDLQLQVFREEVQLSEQLQKPLFLHCVRAIDDVLRIRRELHARQPVIWHGYRGNALQLQQLLPHTFYFSFGTKFNTEALLSCPLDRLLLETDEDTQHPIADLYAEIAHLLNISPDSLIRQMHENYRTLFTG